MNVRSKNLKIRNLPKGHKRIDCVNSKPFVFFALSLIMGILLILLVKSYMIGGVLIAISLYNFLFIKNDRLIEFYDEFAVFYHTTAYKDECFLLFWDDIGTWRFQHTKTDYDELRIRLKNGKEVSLKCVSKHKVMRYFKRYACTRKQEGVLPSKTS